MNKSITEKLDELYTKLEKWQNKYDEAEKDIEEAEERREEAQEMCEKIEAQIDSLKKQIRAKIIEKIVKDTPAPLDLHKAILKASIYTSNEADFRKINYVAITQNQVIGCDGFRVYIANVDVPADKQNIYISVDEHNQEKFGGPIENMSNINAILRAVENAEKEGCSKLLVKGSRMFFEENITIRTSMRGHELCILKPPFIKSGFQKKYIDDTLTVMGDGIWTFIQKDDISMLLIMNEKEKIGLLPVRLGINR